MKVYSKQLTGVPLFGGDNIVFSEFPNKSFIIFDIETTGFSPKATSIYLIGAVYYKDEGLTLTQWFSESPREERQVLECFTRFLSDFDVLVSFNGEGFDIPYLNSKCEQYNITFDLNTMLSVDIFKKIKKMKKHLGLSSCRQKSIEEFLSINRDDEMDGGQLINIYREFVRHPDEDALKLLCLHNHDDIKYLNLVAKTLNYQQLLNGDYKLKNSSYDPEKCGVLFCCDMRYPLPKELNIDNDGLELICSEASVRLFVPSFNGTLKHFYKDYKNYYYLPAEDMAIHKSVASYVDKEYRQKATASNCYSKAMGNFLPQRSEIVTPSFKDDYKDKLSYFFLNEEFLKNKNLQEIYVKEMIKQLLSSAQ